MHTEYSLLVIYFPATNNSGRLDMDKHSLPVATASVASACIRLHANARRTSAPLIRVAQAQTGHATATAKFNVSILKDDQRLGIHSEATPAEKSGESARELQIRKTFIFDNCADETRTEEDFFNGLNLDNAISRRERRRLIFSKAFAKLMASSSDSKIYYGYFGVTDLKVVNLLSERAVPVLNPGEAHAISSDLMPLLVPLTNSSEIENIIEAEKIASVLATPGFSGTIPYHESYLTLMCSRFLGENAQSVFILNLDPTDSYSMDENELAIECWNIMKKIHSVETPILVDKRVTELERHAETLQGENERLKELSKEQEKSVATASSRISELENLVDKLQKSSTALAEQHRSDVAVLEADHKRALAATHDKHKAALVAQETALRSEFEQRQAELSRRFAEKLNNLEMERKESDFHRGLAEQEAILEKNILVCKIAELETCIKSLEVELLDAKHDTANVEVKFAALTDSFSFLKSENETMAKAIHRITAENSDEKKLHRAAEERAKHIQSKLSNAETNLASTERSVKSLTEEVQRLQTSLKDTASELSDRELEIEKYRKTIESMRKEAEEAKAANLKKISLAKSEGEQLWQRELQIALDAAHEAHAAELAALVRKHQEALRNQKRAAETVGLEAEDAAKFRVDELESKIKTMERNHTRDLERCKRQLKIESEERIKDFHAQVEEAEQAAEGWKNDVERLQKVVEAAKRSLRKCETEINEERDSWDSEKISWDKERTELNARNTFLEKRLKTISETLKTAPSAQGEYIDIHKTLMVATEVPPQPIVERRETVRKRTSISGEVLAVLETSVDVGKHRKPVRMRKAPVISTYAESDKIESDEEGTEGAVKTKKSQRHDRTEKADVNPVAPARESEKSGKSDSKGTRSKKTAASRKKPEKDSADESESESCSDIKLVARSASQDAVPESKQKSKNKTAGEKDSTNPTPPVGIDGGVCQDERSTKDVELDPYPNPTMLGGYSKNDEVEDDGHPVSLNHANEAASSKNCQTEDEEEADKNEESSKKRKGSKKPKQPKGDTKTRETGTDDAEIEVAVPKTKQKRENGESKERNGRSKAVKETPPADASVSSDPPLSDSPKKVKASHPKEKNTTKKRKLSSNATCAVENDEEHLPAAPATKFSSVTRPSDKKPSPKKLFSFSKPSLAMLPGFQLQTNPTTVGMLSESSAAALAEFEKARAARQGQKRLEALMQAENVKP
ncbi:hypothetical protein HDU83_002562 [Entophlyctis luteolus]|nr:hypothetical protein HDU83_002562 [Entophlyctis luteolus]